MSQGMKSAVCKSLSGNESYHYDTILKRQCPIPQDNLVLLAGDPDLLAAVPEGAARKVTIQILHLKPAEFQQVLHLVAVQVAQCEAAIRPGNHLAGTIALLKDALHGDGLP